MSARTGGEVLLAALKRYGCDRIFGVPGESYLPLLDALYDDRDVDFITCRHEAGAANMAVADAKLTGRPGVCAVSRGPGATHAAIGLHTAQQDSLPLLLLVGQVPLADRGRDAFQEINYPALFGGFAKMVVEAVDATGLPELVEALIAAAMSGRRGPVVLSLPEDVLADRVDIVDRPPIWPPLRAAEAEDIAAIEADLATSERPLLIVGGSGWTTAACRDVGDFATRAGVPVLAGFRSQDIVPPDHPAHAGHLGFALSPALRHRVAESDLLLVVGERLGDVCTQGYTLLDESPRQPLVHVLPDPADFGRVFKPARAILADMEPFARQLAGIEASPCGRRCEWSRSLRSEFEAWRRMRPGRARLGVADPEDVLAALQDRLPVDAIVANGAGNYTGWVSRFHRYGGWGTQLAPVSGAMGFGVPAAIAAKLRMPERMVVAIAGDGCLLMAASELATAVQAGAAIGIVVLNNGSYGSIAMHQARHHPGRSIGTDLHNPDFAALAAAYGFRTARVGSGRSFAAEWDRLAGLDEPWLIEVLTDPTLVSPPL